MSYYFDRVCKVVILNTEALTIEDHRIKFEVTKSIAQKDNSAKIEIFNLSLNTRKKIGTKETVAQLYAGYSQNQGATQIGQGTICQVSSVRDKTEVVSRILLKDGLINIKNNPISISYETDVKLQDVLARIAKEAGLTLKVSGINSEVIKGGYVLLGGIDYELSKLEKSFNFEWSIQSNVLLITGRKQINTHQILLLTPQTGLILNPESVKKVSQKLQKLKDKGEILNDINTFQVQALLQPQLQLNDIIAVESQDFSGKFRIQKITHIGDTRDNDWYTNLEVKAI